MGSHVVVETDTQPRPRFLGGEEEDEDKEDNDDAEGTGEDIPLLVAPHRIIDVRSRQRA